MVFRNSTGAVVVFKMVFRNSRGAAVVFKMVFRNSSGAEAPATPSLPAAPEAWQMPGAAAAPAGVRGPQLVAALKDLVALHSAGALTEIEFARAKARLLDL